MARRQDGPQVLVARRRDALVDQAVLGDRDRLEADRAHPDRDGPVDLDVERAGAPLAALAAQQLETLHAGQADHVVLVKSRQSAVQRVPRLVRRQRVAPVPARPAQADQFAVRHERRLGRHDAVDDRGVHRRQPVPARA